MMTLVWQHGYGSRALFGIPATGTITQWVPLMMFAFLFGLSMDYEVFTLARIREEYDATGSTREAAVRGIAPHGTAGDQRGADRVPLVRGDGHRA